MTMTFIYGEPVSMRLLIQKPERFSLEKLGMPAEMLARLELGDTLDQHSFVRGGGCIHSNGTGCQGWIGI